MIEGNCLLLFRRRRGAVGVVVGGRGTKWYLGRA